MDRSLRRVFNGNTKEDQTPWKWEKNGNAEELSQLNYDEYQQANKSLSK